MNLREDQERDDLLENAPRHRADPAHEALQEKVPKRDPQVKAADKDQRHQRDNDEHNPKQGRARLAKRTDQSASTT